MDDLAYIGRKHQYMAPCTDATSTLYWHYKHLVLALQSILYRRYKHIVVSVQNAFRCTANAVVLIHWWQSGVGEQLSKGRF